MADGCPFHAAHLTAASRHLPLGTVLRVRNRANGRAVTVRVSDRGPYVHGRSLDLSQAAAERLDMIGVGVMPLTVQVLRVDRRIKAACQN